MTKVSPVRITVSDLYADQMDGTAEVSQYRRVSRTMLGQHIFLLSLIVALLVSSSANAANTPAQQALFTAIINGHGREAVSKLLDGGSSARIFSVDGYLPLHVSVAHPDIEVTELLLKAYPEALHISGSRGRTPLMFAVRAQQPKQVTLLLEAGASPCNINEENGDSIVHDIARFGGISLLNECLHRCPQLTRHRNSSGVSPLAEAVLHGNWGVFQRLQALSPGVHDAADDGNTLLHIALASGNQSMIRAVLAAYPQYINRRNNALQSPLSLAASSGNTEAYSLLLQGGADPFSLGLDASADYQFGINRGDMQILKTTLPLIERQPEASRQRIQEEIMRAAAKNEKFSFLAIARELEVPHAQAQHLDCLTAFHAAAEGRTLLLRQVLASTTDFSHLNEECPLLAVAAKSGQSMTVAMLLSLGVTNPLPFEGSSPLHYAAASGSLATIRLLLTAYPESITEKNDAGETPFATAMRYNNQLAAALLERFHQTEMLP